MIFQKPARAVMDMFEYLKEALKPLKDAFIEKNIVSLEKLHFSNILSWSCLTFIFWAIKEALNQY